MRTWRRLTPSASFPMPRSILLDIWLGPAPVRPRTALGRRGWRWAVRSRAWGVRSRSERERASATLSMRTRARPCVSLVAAGRGWGCAWWAGRDGTAAELDVAGATGALESALALARPVLLLAPTTTTTSGSLAAGLAAAAAPPVFDLTPPLFLLPVAAVADAAEAATSTTSSSSSSLLAAMSITSLRPEPAPAALAPAASLRPPVLVFLLRRCLATVESSDPLIRFSPSLPSSSSTITANPSSSWSLLISFFLFVPPDLEAADAAADGWAAPPSSDESMDRSMGGGPADLLDGDGDPDLDGEDDLCRFLLRLLLDGDDPCRW